jgi:hypothetical protein
MASAAAPVPMSLSVPRTSPGPPCGPLGATPIVVTPCGYSVGANGRSFGVGEVSMSLGSFSNYGTCPGKNCPN